MAESIRDKVAVVGVGACQATGATQCTADGTPTECSAVPPGTGADGAAGADF